MYNEEDFFRNLQEDIPQSDPIKRTETLEMSVNNFAKTNKKEPFKKGFNFRFLKFGGFTSFATVCVAALFMVNMNNENTFVSPSSLSVSSSDFVDEVFSSSDTSGLESAPELNQDMSSARGFEKNIQNEVISSDSFESESFSLKGVKSKPSDDFVFLNILQPTFFGEYDYAQVEISEFVKVYSKVVPSPWDEEKALIFVGLHFNHQISKSVELNFNMLREELVFGSIQQKTSYNVEDKKSLTFIFEGDNFDLYEANKGVGFVSLTYLDKGTPENLEMMIYNSGSVSPEDVSFAVAVSTFSDLKSFKDLEWSIEETISLAEKSIKGYSWRQTIVDLMKAQK